MYGRAPENVCRERARDGEEREPALNGWQLEGPGKATKAGAGPSERTIKTYLWKRDNFAQGCDLRNEEPIVARNIADVREAFENCPRQHAIDRGPIVYIAKVGVHPPRG